MNHFVCVCVDSFLTRRILTILEVLQIQKRRKEFPPPSFIFFISSSHISYLTYTHQSTEQPKFGNTLSEHKNPMTEKTSIESSEEKEMTSEERLNYLVERVSMNHTPRRYETFSMCSFHLMIILGYFS